MVYTLLVDHENPAELQVRLRETYHSRSCARG